MKRIGAKMITKRIRFQRFLSLKADVFDLEGIQSSRSNEFAGPRIVWNRNDLQFPEW